MRRTASLLVLLGLALPRHLHGQDAGDPQAGLALAREVCAACHTVTKEQMHSPDPDAPTFSAIANVPGMTPLALTVALQTSHETMPNIMLQRDELQDMIAYITSLQERP